MILINQPDIDKTYLYLKHLFESKYQLLISAREKAGIKKLKNPKAVTDYLQIIDDFYENLEHYNPTKKSINSVWWYDSRCGR